METSHGLEDRGVEEKQDLGTCHLTNWKKTSRMKMGICSKVSG